MLIDVSPKTGQPVYIRDVAEVERRYKDPTFLVRFDSQPCILLSLEMQKGRNVVELGDQIAAVFHRLESKLPPDVKIDLVADQPKVVKERISYLSKEFLMAIIAVILVTMLLLPLRVSIIAALAIPITLFISLGLMNAFGVELHQVSISSLVVILGIIVDDAIVIADNYLVLLERGTPPADVLWRSAGDVVIPVLTATVTIICSFLPLLILTGYVGEFIHALPLTVGIALGVSFLVAILVTPLLCRIFIRQNKASDDEGSDRQKHFNLLEGLQVLYGKTIVYFMNKKILAVGLGLAAVALGALLFVLLPQQFFPQAERNQFIIDVWMKQGTRIEATSAVMKRIEARLASHKEIAHFASFIGQSAPRFYYNVNVHQPDGAYGQMIVNTQSAGDTPRLVHELRRELALVVPEALVIVKELQQGAPLKAPVEVRISGEDINELKRIGADVEGILRKVPFSEYVYNDYFNDSYMMDVRVNTELANRLGLTNAYVSNFLAGALDGAPVSVFWEGDRPLPILLRLAPESRSSFADITNTYVTSPVTGAGVPLRSVATLTPEWQTSRIVRKNGVRTLTVQGYVREGYYGSELLKTARPRIDALPLPAGYRIEYGGENANQGEVFPLMLRALGISLVTIFLVLLIQFRSVSEPLIIMASIPLALLGAAVGLWITGNPFGFTAFLGLVSLCGIVVRNAIILVDYINEKLAEGKSLTEAATEAGQRRLRPIFLTTMAAAVGVTPMIVSRSSLWSPLASVIAVGLIFSMFFTLLVVPVLFVVVKSRLARLPSLLAALLLILAASFIHPGESGAETKHLTLPSAVHIALQQNTVLRIAESKVRENNAKVSAARADYLPRLSNTSVYSGLTNKSLFTDPTGITEHLPSAWVDAFDERLHLNRDSLFFSSTALQQPLTQLLKVHKADHIAQADREIAKTDYKRAQREIVYGVHRLYYGILIARKQKETARAAVASARENLRDADNAFQADSVLEVAVIGSRTLLLQNRQAELAADIQIEDLVSEMNHLLGLPPETELVLADVPAPEAVVPPRSDYLRNALGQNPEILAARELVVKSQNGVEAAYYDYLPEISLFARHTYQDFVPFVTRNIGTYGAVMTWNMFDWGKRRAVIRQRKELREQAQLNLSRLEKRLAVDVDKAYRKLDQTKMMIDVAGEALALQKENLRLSENRLQAGAITAAKHAEAIAQLRKAESDLLAATLAYRLALAEIDRTAGTDDYSL